MKNILLIVRPTDKLSVKACKALTLDILYFVSIIITAKIVKLIYFGFFY
ncbi:hypothetical protein KSI01_30770 [Kurthia sibirica]|nr:hypothetical protein KSI01_30770 [Kurthia sibirica]